MLQMMLLSGVVAAAPAPVDFEVVDVRKVEMGLKRTSFDLVTEVSRDSGMTVNLRKLDYVIRVGDVVVDEQSLSLDGVKLRPGEPQQITIPCEFSTMSTAGALLGSLTSGALKVSVEGMASARVLIFPIVVPFETPIVEVGG